MNVLLQRFHVVMVKFLLMYLKSHVLYNIFSLLFQNISLFLSINSFQTIIDLKFTKVDLRNCNSFKLIHLNYKKYSFSIWSLVLIFHQLFSHFLISYLIIYSHILISFILRFITSLFYLNNFLSTSKNFHPDLCKYV